MIVDINIIAIAALSLISLVGFFFILQKMDKNQEENSINLLEERDSKIALLEVENRKLIEENSRLHTIIETHDQTQKSLEDRLKNLSNEILDKTKEKFKEESKESLEHLLKPFSDNMKSLKEELNKQYTGVSKEIIQLMAQTNDISKRADELTRALTSDSKTQGNYGESILERVLEYSGLKKDIHYLAQSSELQNSSNKIPDITLKLPDDKVIIIDSKVSLNNYEKYINEEDVIASKGYLNSFISNVKDRVKELSRKEYELNVSNEYKALDFTILFMPIEGAYFELIKNEPDIINDSLRNKKVLISTTGNLIGILKAIELIWKHDEENKNVSEVFKQLDGLEKKARDIITSFEDVGKHLDRSQASYKIALDRLSTGHKDTFLRKIERLRDLEEKTNLLENRED